MSFKDFSSSKILGTKGKVGATPISTSTKDQKNIVTGNEIPVTDVAKL